MFVMSDNETRVLPATADALELVVPDASVVVDAVDASFVDFGSLFEPRRAMRGLFEPGILIVVR
jgi:hypothetical protein